jgi:hypothetical protein
MREYIYLCPNCADSLWSFIEPMHDGDNLIPCGECGQTIDLLEETPDVRESENWSWREYGDPAAVYTCTESISAAEVDEFLESHDDAEVWSP